MPTNAAQVRRVLIITLALNVAVAVGKIIIGAISGALAITADGLHSLVDASGNIAGLIGMRYSQQPPDADHPYGHSRYETLAALFIGGMLLLTAWEVIKGAVERLGGGEAPQITPTVLAVMLATLAVNIGVSRYQIRMGRKLRSQILLADAANTRADVFVTLSVLASLGLMLLTGWAWVDVAAALVVTLFIARAAWAVIAQTGRVLVDTAPYDPDHLAGVVAAVPSVDAVARVRSRGAPGAAHIDVDVQVAPEMTAGQTAAIAAAIRAALHDDLDGVGEVEVHFEPVAAAEPDLALAVRARADALGLATHEVRVISGPRGHVLDLHVEVAPGQTIDAAHAQVSRLEHDLLAALPDVAEVVSHIEPAQPDPASAHPGPGGRALAAQIEALLCQHYPDYHWHDLRLTADPNGCAALLHVGLPAYLSIEVAHAVAEEAELLLRANLPRLARVTIHTEPLEEPAHDLHAG